MLQNGGGAYDAAGKLILNTPENVEALQFVADMVNVHKIAAATPGGNNGTPEFYAAMPTGKFASVWMPQWYMTRFPDNMAALCGKMVVRPMPLFEEGGFTTTMGGGTGHRRHRPDPGSRAAARQGLPDLRQADQGRPDGDLDGPRASIPTATTSTTIRRSCSAGSRTSAARSTFEIIKSELGNVAPEYTGPQYPEIQDYFDDHPINDIVNNGVSAADALAAAQVDHRSRSSEPSRSREGEACSSPLALRPRRSRPRTRGADAERFASGALRRAAGAVRLPAAVPGDLRRVPGLAGDLGRDDELPGGPGDREPGLGRPGELRGGAHQPALQQGARQHRPLHARDAAHPDPDPAGPGRAAGQRPGRQADRLPGVAVPAGADVARRGQRHLPDRAGARRPAEHGPAGRRARSPGSGSKRPTWPCPR